MRGASIPLVVEATSSIADASAVVPVVLTDMPWAKTACDGKKKINDKTPKISKLFLMHIILLQARNGGVAKPAKRVNKPAKIILKTDCQSVVKMDGCNNYKNSVGRLPNLSRNCFENQAGVSNPTRFATSSILLIWPLSSSS